MVFQDAIGSFNPKITIGKSIDTQIIEGKNKKFAVLMGEIGLVKGGIIYTNLRVDSLGDTFTYNIVKDKFIASKYALNASNLEFDNLYATTAGDKLYVVYGFAMADDEGKEFGSNKSKLSNKDFYDEDDYEDDWEPSPELIRLMEQEAKVITSSGECYGD